jgi:uncharacterized protein
MAILASMLWRRIDTPGHDACWLEQEPGGWRLSGVAVFLHASGPTALSYCVRCDSAWITLDGRAHGSIGDRQVDYSISRDGGVWRLNGETAPGLGHLLDLDFSFTPATNFLQLKRVPLPLGEAISLPAAWFDLETGALTQLRQTYERRDDQRLHYQAPDVGYEDVLELAPSGFIRRYPGLWEAE